MASEQRSRSIEASSGHAEAWPALEPAQLVPVSVLRDHPQASLVPEMRDEEYRALLLDLKENPFRTPLDVSAKNVVLDGRHRLRAARELGFDEVPARVVLVEDELDHIIRAALNRRHLSESQRAALAVELGNYRRLKAEAKARSLANLVQLPERATLPARKGRTRDLLAEMAGTSPRQIQDALTVYEADPALFERVKAGLLPVHRAAQRVRRERKLASLPAVVRLPEGPYELIYADPPWASETPTSDYAPENHYPTMALEEIKALPVPAAESSILFLWVTSSLLLQGLEVMAAWGFTYKTSLVWVKDSIGLGRWVRHRHELLLLGRRGDFPLPAEADRPDSVIEAPRGRHSQKPACVYELLERMRPEASRLELFARGPARPGWSAWGNEVEAA